MEWSIELNKQTYIPSTDEVRYAYAWEREGWGGEAFDRWLAQHDAETAARAWNEALDHVWELNDPAYTVVHTSSQYPVVTWADVLQSRAENPYRGDIND